MQRVPKIKPDARKTLTNRAALLALLCAVAVGIGLISPRPSPAAQKRAAGPTAGAPSVAYRTVKIDGLDISYREAGRKDAPAILLLHGFPTSSHMYRSLIPRLADEFRLVAPDYPGFGASSMPPRDQFDYTFDNLAGVIEKFTEKIGLKKYALYVQDYGAPVGFRLAVKHPDRVTAIVVQNGNAYDEGIDNDFWKPIKAYWRAPHNKEKREALRPFTKLEATKWQYTHGARDAASISPDNWFHDQYLLDRPGNAEIQLDLFLSYGSNPPLYPKWQEYFRKHQPPTLIVWGKNDQIFPPAGAEPYKRDLKTIEYHLLDTGHFALEEDGDKIAGFIRMFLRQNVSRK
jgi:pimeloyl-ACP methyl ester carboxylesterase